MRAGQGGSAEIWPCDGPVPPSKWKKAPRGAPSVDQLRCVRLETLHLEELEAVDVVVRCEVAVVPQGRVDGVLGGVVVRVLGRRNGVACVEHTDSGGEPSHCEHVL